jgi:steroid 5-alpha reductase family enzyme
LTHLSFALLAWNTPSTHPALFLGPLANYVFLRFVGGDAQLEANQAERYSEFDPAKERQFKRYQAEVNAFWPKLSALTEPWFLAVVAIGAAGVGAEKIIRTLVKPSVL